MLNALKAVYRLRVLVTPALREIMFLLGVWRPAAPPQDAVVTRFTEINKSYWEPAATSGARILVEGHLAEYGPNYLFRTGVAAKAVQAALGGGDIVVVVNGFSYHWQSAVKAYASFGITRWAFLGRKFMVLGPLLFLCASILAARRFLSVRLPEQLLDIHLGGIKIGDLIYDEVLRSTKQPTIGTVDWTVYKVMARSWFYYYQYHLFFSMGAYRFYIATHTAYPEYGLLCRVALQRGVTVIETSDIQMSTYDSIGVKDLPTYHQGINAEIRAALESGKQCMAEREARARESLRRRLDSEIMQIDAQKAYSGKSYTPQELRVALNIPADHRIGFIAAHIFCDSPHLSSSMLHADYYRWLERTIDCCAGSEGISWVVKPHPSCALYGEEGKVEALVIDSGAANIHICPKNLNTSSLRTCADVLLTVHGTAGLEYACFGIPTILAGTPFYSGFGFTQEPKTAKEYAVAVRRAALLVRLSEEQISKALQVFEAWESQFDWNNCIVTAQVLAYVWGNGVERDLIRAYELLTENLQANNPKELKLWRFASAVVNGERKMAYKPPVVRIALRAQRELASLAQHAYLRLYAAPLLKLKGELDSEFSVARGHGSFLLVSGDSFLKLAISRVAALDQEYANYCQIRALRPDLADALPSYRYIRIRGLSALACERLNKIPYAEALVPAARMYERFRSNSSAGVRPELAACPQITAGVRYLEVEFGADIARDMQTRVEVFLARGQYTTGLSHGDFHSRNLLRDEEGNFQLIDLDCVRFTGISEFDPLYFALEQEWSATGRLWTGVLAECFGCGGRNIAASMTAFAVTWTTGLGIAFFLDRIGQDLANYGFRYEHQDMAAVIDAIHNAVE